MEYASAVLLQSFVVEDLAAPSRSRKALAGAPVLQTKRNLGFIFRSCIMSILFVSDSHVYNNVGPYKFCVYTIR